MAIRVDLMVCSIGPLERPSAFPLEDPVLHTMVKLYSCIAKAQRQRSSSIFWVNSHCSGARSVTNVNDGPVGNVGIVSWLLQLLGVPAESHCTASQTW